MSEINTFFIADPRYADITSSVSVAVKDGPASVIAQSYTHNSNSTSNTLYNVNVPSENTLVDRNMRVEGTVSVRYTTTKVAGDGLLQFRVVPAAFPLNQALSSASLTINNSKVSVQSADVVNIITKQYHQKFLSQHCQMTPNYVYKYFGKCSEATSSTTSSSYMNGVRHAEKDTDTIGRADSDYTVVVTRAGVVVAPDTTGLYQIPDADAGEVI